MGENCYICGATSNRLMIPVVVNNKNKHICIDCLADEIHSKIARNEL